MTNTIQVYEHGRLPLGDQFQEHHRKALLKLNELHSFNYLEGTYKGVKFKNYVGVVQVDGLCIEILPKIDNQDTSKDQWRGVLIDMLRTTGKIKATEVNSADVRKRRYNLLEVYLDMFLREIEQLQRQGLCKQYKQQTSNTLALKGKLELAGHISKNLVHKERFYTTHQVYDHDHLIHQVLRKAIDIVVGMTRQSYLAARSGRVHLSFPDVDSSAVTLHTFDKIHLTRKTRQYEKALEIARIIIENYSPSITAGSSRMLALLFNMNSLWEQYVFEVLRKGQNKGGYQVSKPSKSLLDGGAYSLQPDMFVEFGVNRRLIIDTKWKVPKQQKASMADLRQIYAYNRYWNASHGVLLYPGDKADSSWMKYLDDQDIPKDEANQEPKSETSCKIAFLNVLTEDGMLDRELDVLESIHPDS